MYTAKYATLQPDKKIDHYAYCQQALIGNGTFGRVYLGKDLKTNELVAIKVIENKNIEETYLKKSLGSEVKIMRALKSPYIVHLYDVLISTNRTYLI